MSTIDRSATLRLAAALRDRGLRFVDAPAGGGTAAQAAPARS